MDELIPAGKSVMMALCRGRGEGEGRRSPLKQECKHAGIHVFANGCIQITPPPPSPPDKVFEYLIDNPHYR